MYKSELNYRIDPTIVNMAQDPIQPSQSCVPLKVMLTTPQRHLKSEYGVTYYTRSCLVSPLPDIAVPSADPTLVLSHMDAFSISAAGFLYAVYLTNEKYFEK